MILNPKMPILNVHGETRDTVKFIVESYIKDNIKLENEYIGIIHGRSSSILKDAIHTILKQNKNVISWQVDIFNPGITIIKLKVNR